jgi:hypothetical protein
VEFFLLPKTIKPDAIKALELRKAGATPAQIGRELKKSPDAVRQMINTALAELYNPRVHAIDSLKRLDDYRLEGYLLALAPAISAGDHLAIKTAVAILDRRAKMWGYDSATKLELSGDLKIDVSQPKGLNGKGAS